MGVQKKRKGRRTEQATEMGDQIEHFEEIERHRKRAEAALRNSELRYRTLFEASTDAIFLETLEGRIIDCNATACEMLGYAKEELIGLNVSELMPDEVAKTLPEVVSRVLSTGGVVLESLNKRKDGSVFPAEVSIRLVTLGGEQLALAYVRDISERKRHEEAILAAERDKQSILDTLSELVAYQDAEMRIVWANRAAVESVGLSGEEIIGRHCYELWGDGNGPCAGCVVQKALKAGRPQEGQRAAPDGKAWLIRGYPVLDEKGDVHGAIEVTLEITERVRTEELMRAQRDLGLALGEARGLKETLRLCFEAALRVSGMDCGGIYLVDEKSGRLDLAFHQGLHSDFVRSVAHYDADSANARLVMCGEPVYTRHGELRFPLGESEIRERLRAIAVIPVHYEDRVIACLNVASHTLEEVPSFSQTSLEAVATQIGEVIARSKMEEALRESEERTRALLNAPPDPAMLINVEGIHLAVNEAAAAVIGKSVDEVIGTCGFEVSPRTLAELRKARTEEVIRFRKPVRFEEEYQGRVFHTNSYPVFDAGGRVTALAVYARDVTERKRADERKQRITRLKEDLLGPHSLDEKLNRITDGIVEIFDADFARIWITEAGDVCDSGCCHAKASEGPHACRHRDRCLHLRASSGRYTHIDGKVHRRVPFGCYKIGRIASGKDSKFLTNDVANDARVHNRQWATELGLVSFAGHRLLSADKEPIGVLCLFSKHSISPDEDALLEDIANTSAQVIQTAKAEESLRESEEKYRALFESSPNAIALVGLDGVVRDCNPATEVVAGIPRSQIVGKHFSKLTVLSLKEVPNYVKAFSRLAAGKSVGPLQVPVARKGGEPRWAEAFPALLKRGKKPTGIQVIARDITERKYTEDAYRALVDHSLQGLLIVRDARILFANRAFADTSGYTVKELLAMSADEVQGLVHPEDRAMVWGRHLQRLKGVRLPDRYEFRAVRKDGTIRWLEMSTTKVDYQGKPAVQSAIVDITERRAAEQALRTSEEGERQFSGHLKTLHEISNVLSKADSVDELCRQAVELGRSRLAFDRLSVWLLAPEDHSVVVGTWGVDEKGDLRDERGCRLAFGSSETIKTLLLQRTPYVLFPDTSLYDARGRVIGRGANIAAALWDGEEVVGYMSADNLLRHHPITERHCELLTLYASTLGHLCTRKRAESQRRDLQGQLAQAQKMQALGTLAGGVSHEYNNILASVIGYTDLALQTEDLPEGLRRNLEVVRSSAVRGADLTQSLLTFSRKEVGKKKPLDVTKAVEEVLKVTGKEFTSEGIELTVEHSSRVPPVMGDASMLKSVVMNLIINARHAMLDSKVRRLTIQTGMEGKRVFIRIADTGCGIPKKHLPRLFEPFFTTKEGLEKVSPLKKARGTGLGLSVCHSMIEGHGGEIKVTSQEGKGTTFTIYLPAAPKHRTTRPEAERKPTRAVSRILVVDDEEAIVDLLVEMLGRCGYEVDGFTAPSEALDAARAGHYSVVFVDLQMPEMSGETFIERLNDLPLENPPQKVILTGRLIGAGEDFEQLRVFATLSKPFSPQQVIDVVERIVAARTGPASDMGGQGIAG